MSDTQDPPEVIAAREAALAALPNYNEQSRQALADALALADLYPSSPEEAAIINAQIASALAQYRALENPPADIVSLASSLISLKTESML